MVPKKLPKEIRSIRPVHLYTTKQKIKHSECTPIELRKKFARMSIDKQGKYYQKAIDKFIDLLDEKEIDQNIQVENRFFDRLMVKTQQKKYFEWLNAPVKPRNTLIGFYHAIKKQDNENNPPAWKSLDRETKVHYAQLLAKAKAEYIAQVNNFAENLPDRIKPEYLRFAELSNRRRQSVSTIIDDDENSMAVSQRRKSMSSEAADSKDLAPKLTRIQLDQLHQCMPARLYYKKISDDEKPSFTSRLSKNAHIRSVFAALSEKKKKKFITKATQKWQALLDQHPSIVDRQIPTLHLLLSRNEDIITYFSILGLPQRPPRSAAQLFHLEMGDFDQKWINLSKEMKNPYIERWSKMKSDYHRQLENFIENILPSDYIRQEFFRNMKQATIDYELSRKKKTSLDDPYQSKITQYYQRKMDDDDDIGELDRIVRRLFATQLTEKQKDLVEKLIELVDRSKKNTKTSLSNHDGYRSDDASIVEMDLNG